MSTKAVTLTRDETPEGSEFFQTWPLWVLDAAVRLELPRKAVDSVRVMPKTAEATLFDGSVIKLRRRDAFPGRGV